MSIQKPEPYDFDGADDYLAPTEPVEVDGAGDDDDDRARTTRLERISLAPGRTCISCGYDLTGLFVGGNCPECGDKILSIAPSAVIDAYKRMPEWYLSLLSAAMATMLILSFALVLFVVLRVTGNTSFTAPSMALSSVFQMASVVWVACVVAISFPPPEREPVMGLGRSRGELFLSVVTVVSQLGFPLSALAPFFVKFTGLTQLATWSYVPSWTSSLCIAIVALQLGATARRLSDEDRSRMLHFAAIAIVIGDVTAVMLLQPLSVLLLGWGYAYFCWSLWSLSREAGWAVRNARAAEARIERIRERARKNFEQAQREREAEAPFGGPLP